MVMASQMKAKIDMEKQGLTIYGDFVPFCEETDSSESKETNDSNHAGLKQWSRNFIFLFKDTAYIYDAFNHLLFTRTIRTYGGFAIERKETPKKINFIFIC